MSSHGGYVGEPTEDKILLVFDNQMTSKKVWPPEKPGQLPIFLRKKGCSPSFFLSGFSLSFSHARVAVKNIVSSAALGVTDGSIFRGGAGAPAPIMLLRDL